jgi:hypothetical protein
MRYSDISCDNLHGIKSDIFQVERLKPSVEGDVVNNGAPIKIKFPNVREKVRVLQAGRPVAKILREENISIIEDFTDKVTISHLLSV